MFDLVLNTLLTKKTQKKQLINFILELKETNDRTKLLKAFKANNR